MSNKDDTFRNCTPDLELAFPKEEYRARLGRIRERMARDKIDLLFLTAPESLNYVSGYQCEWYQAQSPKQWPATSGIAVHVDRDTFIQFDTEREQVLIRYCTVAEDTRIFPPASMRDGIAFIVSELAAERWLPGRVGLELWSYRPNRPISERFEAAFRGAGCDVVDGSDVLREVRWVKSPAELACMEEAARIADLGLRAAQDALEPGVMELEVYGAMVHAMAAAGGENPGITMPVLSGRKANCGHALASRRRIGAGEIVFIDVCGVHKRYHVNQARTFSMGEPAPDVREIARRSAGSIDVLRRMIRPNMRVGDLTKALMDYYIAQGIWQERGWIGGYELGIAFPPDWVGNFVYDPLSPVNADRLFEPGTVVNYENQFVLPRHVGTFFMIETIMFGQGEARLMSSVPHDLIVIE